MKLLFITTFINDKYIYDLLQSCTPNKSLELELIIVAQNGLKIDIAPYISEHTKITVVEIENQLNSSASRNLGIDYVHHNDIKSDFVMFPDDDSTFDRNFFENFTNAVQKDKCYLTDVYERGSKQSYFLQVRNRSKIGIGNWNNVGAVNMVLNFDILKKTGRFDEMMGVAAPYGAGEDSDMFIRTVKAGGSFIYSDKIYSYHPSGADKYANMAYKEILKRFKNYGRGVVYVTMKHKMYDQALKICFKGLAGSVMKFFALDFKMSCVYFYAFYWRITTFFQLL